MTLQQPSVAAQTVLSKEDSPIGMTILTFTQLMGGTIFVTVSQTVLLNKMIVGLTGKVSGFDPSAIANEGVTSLRKLVPANELDLVLEVYNQALQSIWYVGLALVCLVFVASWGFEWKSVRAPKKEGPADADKWSESSKLSDMSKVENRRSVKFHCTGKPEDMHWQAGSSFHDQ